MDLIPLNQGIESHHFNWTGWSCIMDLLRDCGADLALASGSNDGDKVDAITALSWGLLLQQRIDEMVVVEVPDKYMAGGIRSEIRILERYIDQPLTSSELMHRRIRTMHGEEEPKEPVNVRQMDDDDRQWVMDAAQFFILSGGFEQC